MDVFENVVWKKSSRSDGQGANCVEVAVSPDAVGVRDSKDRDGATLAFTPDDWAAFLTGIKSGEFDS
ncbi:hypothetical protein Cme02nite_60420 [Catellatospora methionotrophica]|uniref:DUF397 domain-containing protein n=1 Tax=Catellatospora methionotrophica TaxID=121620 RepID=A0A8J3LNB3_9ACTN|nr:DUF397 domain-containing protein [Catellatospora methionotrophica]GIG17710.1 hypothetical protein Cme02nite_60420 [Catellatospora methionotrophica]